MKYIQLLILLNLFLSTKDSNAQPVNFNCGCNLNNSPRAELKINGVSYYSNSPTNPTAIPSIQLPLGQASFTDVITVIQNVVCKPVITGSSTNCATATAKTDIIIQNPNVVPVSGNYFSGNSTTYSYSGGLQTGINTITVYANCKSGISSGSNGQACAMASFKVNIINTPNTEFNASITNECHYTVTGPKHLAVYSGNQLFKINFSVLPPSGTVVQLFKNNAYIETLSVTQLMVNTDYLFSNNNTGYGYANYKIKFINNGSELLPAGRTASYSLTSSRKSNSCLFANKIEKKPDMNISAKMACSGNGDCPSGTTCVDGACQ